MTALLLAAAILAQEPAPDPLADQADDVTIIAAGTTLATMGALGTATAVLGTCVSALVTIATVALAASAGGYSIDPAIALVTLAFVVVTAVVTLAVPVALLATGASLALWGRSRLVNHLHGAKPVASITWDRPYTAPVARNADPAVRACMRDSGREEEVCEAQVERDHADKAAAAPPAPPAPPAPASERVLECQAKTHMSAKDCATALRHQDAAAAELARP